MYIDPKGGRWYKGNLHAHSTLSDGALAFDEVVKMYRQAGYDFLAVTDHWIPSETVEDPDFLLLAGCEYDAVRREQYYKRQRDIRYDINGIGFTLPPQVEQNAGWDGQMIVDAILKAGGLAFYNHPAWLRNRAEDILPIEGLSGIEIYNTFTGMAPHFTLPYSGPVLDELAFGGKLLPAIATDDPHDYQGEQLKSYILLNAASLCYQDVMEALRQGKFLATQGPWLSVAVHDSVVYVETTPVACVRLISDSWMSCQRTGEGITALEFPIPADASYIRVEAEDEQGRTAWSSPIALQ